MHDLLQERPAVTNIIFDGYHIIEHHSIVPIAAVDLLAPRPGGLAFRTFAARSAGVFL